MLAHKIKKWTIRFYNLGIGSSSNLTGGSTNPPGNAVNISGVSGSKPGGPKSLPGESSGHSTGLHMTGTKRVSHTSLSSLLGMINLCMKLDDFCFKNYAFFG